MIRLPEALRDLMGALSLPRPARLTRRAEFETVRRRGRSWHGSMMIMSGWMNTTPESPRFGVITSRKVGSAVERTRTRRRLREIFRLHRGVLPSGLWMVVVARRAAAVANFSALRGEWRELAVRAGYLQA